MAEQFICELENRTLVKIGGDEAESFLQGILTCNVEIIKDGSSGFGGLLSPQGKILFDFFIVRVADTFLLDVVSESLDELTKRLMFYRLRAKVSIERADGRIFAAWGNEKPNVENSIIVEDPRLPILGWRVYGDIVPIGTKTDYDSFRISHGIPEACVDYMYGSAFPHEALYDQIGGVDFSKGCYVGQEVISRVHHRGTARKRIIQISSDSALPDPGTAITANKKSAGEITSVSGNVGLGILRLDRVKDAIDSGEDIYAGETKITATIQNWARFDWPGS